MIGYVVRGWHKLPSGNVCLTVVDLHGQIVTCAMPSRSTIDGTWQGIIAAVLDARQPLPPAAP